MVYNVSSLISQIGEWWFKQCLAWPAWWYEHDDTWGRCSRR